MKTFQEADQYVKKMKDPNDIFEFEKEYQNLPESEKEKFDIKYGDKYSMLYITAVEMKKEGTWEDYCKKNRKNSKEVINKSLEEKF